MRGAGLCLGGWQWWRELEGSVLWWLSLMGMAGHKHTKFADLGFPYQFWSSNNSGNAKRLHMINC